MEDRTLRELSPEVTLRSKERSTVTYSSDHLATSFLARQSTMAYQEMLVSGKQNLTCQPF